MDIVRPLILNPARFSTHTAIAKSDLRPHEYGNAFANRARTHLASSLAVPSRETVSALTLLAVLGLSNGRPRYS
jgi:hypothetical protein